MAPSCYLPRNACYTWCPPRADTTRSLDAFECFSPATLTCASLRVTKSQPRSQPPLLTTPSAADTKSLDAFKSFFLDKKLAKDTNVVLMYRTGGWNSRKQNGETCAYMLQIL